MYLQSFKNAIYVSFLDFLIFFLFEIFSAKPAVASSNLKLITEIMCSNRVLNDPRIFTGCLRLMMNSVQPDKSDKTNKEKAYYYYKRYDNKDVIDGVIERFKQFFFYPKLPNFESIASQVINFLYKMCNTPDLLCQDLIHALCVKLVEISTKRNEKMMDTSENGVESSQVTEMYIPDYMLPRIIFVFGYVASKEMVYLDIDVYSNIKHREELAREKKEQKDTNNKRKTTNLNASASEALKRLSSANNSTTGEVQQQEQDEAYMGATAEDSLAEMINNICENELIGSTNGILYHLIPLLTEILRQPAIYPDQHVQRAAVLTFMRFMVVSGKFCQEKISFLMNILKKTQNAAMKCNIIVGLADLTCRFANTIEPWIPYFYGSLLESDQTVRLVTMKMLSYVILQAIVRVTGHISCMAVCLVDENNDIQIATKEFFRQLVASKEADYYKILPDIVSRLSSQENPIEETKFREIMKYLLQLIQKDRQVENIVEKLCNRFRNTNSERQWRDIAFCLSMLNHTEKTMKKLIEHLPDYKDKVQYDDIYDCFKLIISNANKQVTKVELKAMAKEFDTKLQECFQINENGDVSVGRAENENDSSMAGTQSTANNKKKQGQKSKKVSKQKRLAERFEHLGSSDEDDDDNDDFVENAPPARKGKARNTQKTISTSTRGKRNARQRISSESEESDEPVVPQQTRRRGKR